MNIKVPAAIKILIYDHQLPCLSCGDLRHLHYLSKKRNYKTAFFIFMDKQLIFKERWAGLARQMEDR